MTTSIEEIAAQIRSMKPDERLTLVRALLLSARNERDIAKSISTLTVARNALRMTIDEIDAALVVTGAPPQVPVAAKAGG